MAGDTTVNPDLEADRPLRRDAARNRALILETAAVVFAEHGLDAGYDEIARRSGLGVGTVYRRFPERAELVRALFESRIHEVVAIADQAIALPTGWEGLVHFVERTLELQVADRGLKELLATLPDDVHVDLGRDLLADRVDRIVARAHDEGALRDGIGPTDIGVLLALLSSVVTSAEPELWRRYLSLALDGLSACAHHRPLACEAPSEDAIHELMGNLRGR